MKLEDQIKDPSDGGRFERWGGIWIHSESVCDHAPCPFHHPSNHHMVGWPKNVRLDREGLVERFCPDHGVGHPDPDSVAWLENHGLPGNRKSYGVHGCDGCCSRG